MAAGPPRANAWRETTSTRGGRWAVAIAAGALALLLLLGIGIAGLFALRFHDRVNLLGSNQQSDSRGNDGSNDARDPRADGRGDRRDLPRTPGRRDSGPLGGAPLHGQFTASTGGSVQTLLFQHGEVTAVSATSITVKSSDAFVGTYGLNTATRSNGANAVRGDQAFVLARASDKVAIRVIAVPAR
jgi:hypothetical protein